MNPTHDRGKHVLLAALALLTTAAIYWAGARGPFLFDDYWVLTPIEKWYLGELSWTQAALPNPRSIIDSRPVAMASFMLTTWLGGIGSFPTKLGNLILHLSCGALIGRLLFHLLEAYPTTRSHARLLSWFLAAAWLLHPLHVSTVLYSVQRMSQLSAVFVLLCALTYMRGDRMLAAGERFRATAILFVAFPAFLVLGILSKQNAVIAPFLCLVIAAGRQDEGDRSPSIILRVFFLTFAIVPAVIIVAYLFAHPGLVLHGYDEYDFTPVERLLSQPRALFSYVESTIVPYSPAMGLYTDDFPVSRSLLTPPSTLISIVLLGIITVLALLFRRRTPLFFVGWLFFLVAHSVESSILPLEMYYEHRNYLPSVGLLIAATGLAGIITERFARKLMRLRPHAKSILIGVLASLSIATLGRVLVWQEFETIVEQGLKHHPNSMRAVSDSVSIALNAGNYDGARALATRLAASEEPRKKLFGSFHLVAIDCYEGVQPNITALEPSTSGDLKNISVYEAQMVKLFDNASQFGHCASKSGEIAQALQRIVDSASSQPETSPNKHVPREVIARLYMRAHYWSAAERQAELSWAGGRHPPTGVLLANLYLRGGKFDAAAGLFDELEAMIPAADKGGQEALRRLAEALQDSDQATAR